MMLRPHIGNIGALIKYGMAKLTGMFFLLHMTYSATRNKHLHMLSK